MQISAPTRRAPPTRAMGSLSISLQLPLLHPQLLSLLTRSASSSGRPTDPDLPFRLWRGAGRGRDRQRYTLPCAPLQCPRPERHCRASLRLLGLSGRLSQMSSQPNRLGRLRWQARKGSKWVYQWFLTPGELLDTKEKGIKHLKQT